MESGADFGPYLDIPAAKYLSPSTTKTRSADSRKYRQISTSTDSFKFSFFPRTVPSQFCLLTGLCEYLGMLLLQCEECLLRALLWNPKLSGL